MNEMTTEQLQAAVLFLQQENEGLRRENLALRLRTGDIKLADKEDGQEG